MKRKTKYTGVYEYESQERMHNGRFDVCFYHCIKVDGKNIWTKVGWRSEGITAKYAYDDRCRQRIGTRDGTPRPRKSSILTYAEAFSIFDERHITPNLKNPDEERSRYRRYIEAHIGKKRLNEVSPLDLEKIKNKYSHLSPQSIKHIISDIRRVYRKIILWDLYQGIDPTTKITMPKIDNARTRFLTKQEADALLTDLSTRSLTWWRIASISLYTGMRLSEVLRLTVQDVNLEAGFINIVGSKTGSRTIPMNQKTTAIIKDVLLEGRVQYLFTQRSGAPLKERFAGKVFRECVARLGLNPEGTSTKNRVCFHTLRHSYCSWLAMEGVPLFTIGELVGHTSQEMTKRYSHLCPKGAKMATAVIDNITGE